MEKRTIFKEEEFMKKKILSMILAMGMAVSFTFAASAASVETIDLGEAETEAAE